jgi:hypothetical protein
LLGLASVRERLPERLGVVVMVKDDLVGFLFPSVVPSE